MAEYLTQFLEWESKFNVDSILEFHNAHVELPIFAVSAYLILIFYVPDFIKKGGYNVKPLMALWNLFLAVFSIIGATRLVPKLLSYVDRNKIRGEAWRTTL